MLIITGTGRSGTGMFAKLFGGYHEHRVSYLLKKYFIPSDPFTSPFRSLEKRIMVMRDVHQGLDTERYINSSNLYIHFLDALHYLYPNARFILVVRNGKDFARSAITRKWHEKAPCFGAVPEKDSPYFTPWEKMDPVEKMAWIWVYRNTAALEGLSAVPEEKKMILRLEDCKNDRVLDRLEEFSGFPIKDRRWAKTLRYNANTSQVFPEKDMWDRETHRKFDAIAGHMMDFFRY